MKSWNTIRYSLASRNNKRGYKTFLGCTLKKNQNPSKFSNPSNTFNDLRLLTEKKYDENKISSEFLSEAS